MDTSVTSTKAPTSSDFSSALRLAEQHQGEQHWRRFLEFSKYSLQVCDSAIVTVDSEHAIPCEALAAAMSTRFIAGDQRCATLLRLEPCTAAFDRMKASSGVEFVYDLASASSPAQALSGFWGCIDIGDGNCNTRSVLLVYSERSKPSDALECELIEQLSGVGRDYSARFSQCRSGVESDGSRINADCAGDSRMSVEPASASCVASDTPSEFLTSDMFAKVLANIPHQVFWADNNGVYLGCNESFAKAAGLSSCEAIQGKTDRDMPWCESMTAKSSSIAHAADCAIDAEFDQLQADGRIHHVLCNTVAMTDSSGQRVGTLGLNFDITERRQLESQIAQSQKLEAIGQLAAGIAHEINTPIQFVNDNFAFLKKCVTDVLQTHLPDEHKLAFDSQSDDREIPPAAPLDYEFIAEEVPLAFEEIEDGLQRIKAIVVAMKEFSHPGNTQRRNYDVGRLIESTAVISRGRWKSVAEVELDIEAGLPEVPLLPEFNQVLLNLVSNSVDALEEARGEQTANVDNLASEPGRIVISARSLGSNLELTIADNGPGIPEHIRDKIFEPFFTTKEVGKGTGQGLAISHDIVVNKLKGQIRCEAGPGSGTQFVISLPLQ